MAPTIGPRAVPSVARKDWVDGDSWRVGSSSRLPSRSLLRWWMLMRKASDGKPGDAAAGADSAAMERGPGREAGIAAAQQHTADNTARNLHYKQ